MCSLVRGVGKRAINNSVSDQHWGQREDFAGTRLFSFSQGFSFFSVFSCFYIFNHRAAKAGEELPDKGFIDKGGGFLLESTSFSAEAFEVSSLFFQASYVFFSLEMIDKILESHLLVQAEQQEQQQKPLI